MKYVLVLCRILSRISLLFEQIPATTSADIQEVDAKGNQNRKFIVCCRIYVTIVLCLVHVWSQTRANTVSTGLCRCGPFTPIVC